MQRFESLLICSLLRFNNDPAFCSVLASTGHFVLSDYLIDWSVRFFLEIDGFRHNILLLLLLLFLLLLALLVSQVSVLVSSFVHILEVIDSIVLRHLLTL